MIRVLLVDDQDILLQGLSMILERENDIKVIGGVKNGEEAVKRCKRESIDVVLMDIRMPIMNGVEATREIKKHREDIKIIVLTTFNDDEYIFDSLKYGASGYLLKDAMPKEISEAIRTVYDGGTLINPAVATKVMDRFKEFASNEYESESLEQVNKLTDREKNICSLLAEGLNNREIADELFLSQGTVKNHITNILGKLNLRDRTQLAIFAIKNKI
ncbi:DNA-binding response regulator [Vallitalea longa]|uniref:Stage 0 sporulation protein A homolog n=1 Tax=Vallitalea longa TaxID=2936439 RepID=A0A9W5YBT1_9FIRM|nr:response regulator transcription factor [Vallitalea longa]GKX29781.1 DNA-binding response regulator [Vallitalea longa]